MPPQTSEAVQVRPLGADEHARLRELRLAALTADPEAFGSTHARDAALPAQWWEDWAARSAEGEDERTFVAVAAHGRWLGLAFVRLQDDDPGWAWLGGMWVAPEARGRGIAGRLCEACIRWAAELGACELKLTVVLGNDTARRVYERAGFVVRNQLTATYHGRVLEELVMSRVLP
ncbi:MAG TPA: GNAT family N-acetyltransferase [Solirubrobacteraceae bacterium]|nr:GNAT family N-acetyltransferase [Solirubrobacteraceae bacterium]